jgi:hypothetical protein
MNKCVGIFGWLFGHDFEPRYDVKTHVPEKIISQIVALLFTPWTAMVDLIAVSGNANKTSEYVGDVCRRCGQSTILSIMETKVVDPVKDARIIDPMNFDKDSLR